MGSPDSPNGQEKSFLGGFGMEFRNFNPNGLTSGIWVFSKMPLEDSRDPQSTVCEKTSMKFGGVGGFVGYLPEVCWRFLGKIYASIFFRSGNLRGLVLKIIWCNVMKNLSWWYFQVCCNRLICLVVGHWNPVYFDRRKDPFHDAALTTSLESAERMYMGYRCISCTSFRMFFSWVCTYYYDSWPFGWTINGTVSQVSILKIKSYCLQSSSIDIMYIYKYSLFYIETL